jgi:NAD(P)-dependent dehydrogenase (short-subunit alcohol dehydrogenase family)
MEPLHFTQSHITPHCLANRVILITGASDGIGRTLAVQAAKYGATIILLGKTLKKLESVYDEIVSAGYPEPAIHPLNLLRTESKHAYELAESIHGMFGRLDAVVHNAGISGQICQIEHLTPEKWQEVLQLNLHIPYLLTHALLPLIRMAEHPSILFTTSDESQAGKAYWSAYSASKFGVMGFAQSLHQELEANTDIRVNCINPGKVRTSLRVKAYPGLDPLSLPTPEDIIHHYLYLLSPDAKDIRGKVVTVDPVIHASKINNISVA